MHKLASEAIAPAAQIHRLCSAALIGASQTGARSGALMRKHHTLARRPLDRQDDYLGRHGPAGVRSACGAVAVRRPGGDTADGQWFTVRSATSQHANTRIRG
jgi:hypothetical protein